MADVMLTEVEYRDIPGLEGYRAGSDGTIWSCRRTSRGMTDTWRKLVNERRAVASGNVYVFATLRINGKSRSVAVHRLVLRAFVGECPHGCCACHANDIGDDNRIENLRWDTMKSNMADRHANKRTASGERSNQNVLTTAEATHAVKMIREGFTNKQIAVHLNNKCSPNTIATIRAGVSWKEVWEGRFEKIPCKIGNPAKKTGKN